MWVLKRDKNSVACVAAPGALSRPAKRWTGFRASAPCRVSQLLNCVVRQNSGGPSIMEHWIIGLSVGAATIILGGCLARTSASNTPRDRGTRFCHEDVGPPLGCGWRLFRCAGVCFWLLADCLVCPFSPMAHYRGAEAAQIQARIRQEETLAGLTSRFRPGRHDGFSSFDAYSAGFVAELCHYGFTSGGLT